MSHPTTQLHPTLVTNHDRNNIWMLIFIFKNDMNNVIFFIMNIYENKIEQCMHSWCFCYRQQNAFFVLGL